MLAGVLGLLTWLVVNPKVAVPPGGSVVFQSAFFIVARAPATDDFYQGLVPAAVPYFVLERHFSYVGASGLALAATLGSALPQILVGMVADRHRLTWLAPLGMSLAGLGAGLAGLAPQPALVALAITAASPPAARSSRARRSGSGSRG